MNPETLPEPSEEKRTRRPKLVSECIIDRHLETATGQAQARTIATGYERHGGAFAAFLTLNGIDPHEPDIENLFTSLHAGSYSSQEALGNLVIELHDWDRALENFCFDYGIPQHTLNWNQPELQAAAHALYDIIALDGELHAFYK